MEWNKRKILEIRPRDRASLYKKAYKVWNSFPGLRCLTSGMEFQIKHCCYAWSTLIPWSSLIKTVVHLERSEEVLWSCCGEHSILWTRHTPKTYFFCSPDFPSLRPPDHFSWSSPLNNNKRPTTRNIVIVPSGDKNLIRMKTKAMTHNYFGEKFSSLGNASLISNHRTTAFNLF